MHLGHQNAIIKLSLGGTLLEATVEEKGLRIIVDPHMTFHKQTAAAISKASQMLAVVGRSFANINEFTLPLLFKTMARPLEYCSTVWGLLERWTNKDWNGATTCNPYGQIHQTSLIFHTLKDSDC